MEKYIEMAKEKVQAFVTDNQKQLRKIILLTACVLIGLVVFTFVNSGNVNGIVNDSEDVIVEDSTYESETSSNIFVDIGGEVMTPKLVELPEGSRVEDAIEAAGGLTDDADISSINRAEFLEDGQKVYIPASGEDDNFSSEGNVVTASSGKVNINTADSTELQTLTGVGPATAEKIIDYRTSNGRFKSIEDLKNVSGIGDKTFEKMKDDITV